MHAVAGRSLLLYRSASLRSCRQIAGRRFPVRTFRSSRPNHQNSPSDSANETPAHWQQQPLSDTKQPRTSDPKEEEQDEGTIASNPEPPEPPDAEATEQLATEAAQLQNGGKNSKATYGSGRRRARRAQMQLADADILSRGELPSQNVKLWERLPEEHDTLKEINGGNASSKPDQEIYPNATVGGGAYQIHRDVLFEVHAAVNSGLRPAHEREADSLAAWKAHLVIQSPKSGGQSFLDAVVDNAAQRCRADVIRLDAQDIAGFVADNDPSHSSGHLVGGLTTLGYETLAPYNEKQGKDEDEEDEGSHEDEFGEAPSVSKQGKAPFKSTTYMTQPMVISSNVTNIADLLKQIGSLGTPGKSSKSGKLEGSPYATAKDQPSSDIAIRLVESLMWDVGMARTDAMINMAETANESGKVDIEKEFRHRGCIIHIKDYLEMFSTTAGYSFLRNLHEHILNRRKEGAMVLLVGTSSSEDFMTSNTPEGWKDMQNESNGPSRTIIVPCTSPDVEDVFAKDGEKRTLNINVRHLQDMIRRLTPDPDRTGALCAPGGLELQSSAVYSAGFAEEVWTFDHMQRLAHTVLGLVGPEDKLTADHVEWAVNMIESSDRSKNEWLSRGVKENSGAADAGKESAAEIKEAQQERMRKLRKSCNAHEKRLLNGVIDRSGLKITFGDVHASPDTIDALKNLTSLSLTRPDAFTYGVLASEKIPGLLLYGPPGTGKTLLAKAVAKESGVTILEVSGADIYDMYVGEGEKNVRAIFSLARKVAPCVVFIDEADALFGARGGGGSGSMRNTHREIVNQFLREWDGMSEHSTFIMVATNRPFDLDEAVLRRLPRRLLVDLPAERDRAGILAIHLHGEQLAPDVSLDELARRTPFYSGSDLKNVCVAAALAAVREETEAAGGASKAAAAAGAAAAASSSSTTSSTSTSTSTSPSSAEAAAAAAAAAASSEPPSGPTDSSQQQLQQLQQRYPEKRTLRAEHFERALAEISASISEDMSTLNAIRKFDERYGDRKGRRSRRPGGYGFGLVTDKERDRFDGGRVRASGQD